MLIDDLGKEIEGDKKKEKKEKKKRADTRLNLGRDRPRTWVGSPCSGLGVDFPLPRHVGQIRPTLFPN
jgi:hypothetical protein